MLTFIQINSEIKELYDHYMALTLQHFGSTPLPTKTIGVARYDYPTINHLYHDRILIRGLGHLAQVESFPFNQDAETTFAFMTHTLDQLNLEGQKAKEDILNELLNFWGIFNACLTNNASASAYNTRHVELTIPILKGARENITLTSSHWREYVDPLLKKNNFWLNYVESRGKSELKIKPKLLTFFQETTLISQKNTMERNKEHACINPLLLKEWVDKKNTRADKYQLSSRQQILFNPEASFAFEMDKKVVFSLRELLFKIIEKQQPRTQATFFANKLSGYSLALDIAFVKGRFEIICADPYQSFTQHKFLEILTCMLEDLKIPHRILATQGRLYSDGKHEDILGYLLMQQLKQVSFASLQAQATLPQPQFCFATENKPETAPMLANTVHWFDISLLGAKIALLEENRLHMIERLKGIYPLTHELELKRLTHWYQLDNTTFLEGRRKRLFDRINNIKQPILSLEHIKQSMEVQPNESNGKMLRRAASFGPLHYFESLCTQLEALTLNDVDATSNRSALHWSFIKNKPTRAIHLLEQGVDCTLTDSKGKTAKDYALESKNPDCQAIGKTLY